jgi:pimeloyl-ACP methyl ester carboxylesterase
MPDDGMGVYVPLLPRIVLRVIPDAGHIIAEETPEEVNTGLLALFNAHARPGAPTGAASSVYYSR